MALFVFDLDQTCFEKHLHSAFGGKGIAELLKERYPDETQRPKNRGIVPGDLNDYFNKYTPALTEDDKTAIKGVLREFYTKEIAKDGKGIKNFELLKKSMITALKNGHEIAIASFTCWYQPNDPLDKTKPYSPASVLLEIIFEGHERKDEFLNKIKINCTLPADTSIGKNPQIAELLIKYKEDGKTFLKNEVVLTDDDTKNTKLASNEGYHAIIAPVYGKDTTYLQKFSDMASLTTDQMKLSLPLPVTLNQELENYKGHDKNELEEYTRRELQKIGKEFDVKIEEKSFGLVLDKSLSKEEYAQLKGELEKLLTTVKPKSAEVSEGVVAQLSPEFIEKAQKWHIMYPMRFDGEEMNPATIRLTYDKAIKIPILDMDKEEIENNLRILCGQNVEIKGKDGLLVVENAAARLEIGKKELENRVLEVDETVVSKLKAACESESAEQILAGEDGQSKSYYNPRGNFQVFLTDNMDIDKVKESLRIVFGKDVQIKEQDQMLIVKNAKDCLKIDKKETKERAEATVERPQVNLPEGRLNLPEGHITEPKMTKAQERVNAARPKVEEQARHIGKNIQAKMKDLQEASKQQEHVDRPHGKLDKGRLESWNKSGGRTGRS